MGELLQVFVPKCFMLKVFAHGLSDSQITIYRDYPAAKRACGACRIITPSATCSDPSILSLTVKEILDGDVGSAGRE